MPGGYGGSGADRIRRRNCAAGRGSVCRGNGEACTGSLGCEAVVREKPLLGICLGMQMLLERSEEHGMYEGLGMIPGSVRRFPRMPGLKVP